MWDMANHRLLILLGSGVLVGMGTAARAEMLSDAATPAAALIIPEALSSEALSSEALSDMVPNREPIAASLATGIAPPEAIALLPYSVSGNTGSGSLAPAAIPDVAFTSEITPATTTLASVPIVSQRATIDLKPEVIENSPLLQRWLQQVPDVTSEIANSPSFRPRLRLGYSQFPSTDQSSGVSVGVSDVLLGRSGFTVSGDYYRNTNGQRQAWGADLHYYLRPLGSYINVAPVVGYRRLDTPLYSTDGLNVGLHLLVVLSRGGGADFSLTQTWLSPGSDREVGILSFSAGYALTPTLRLSADLQQQNARQRQDSRAAIVLEWLL
jgi:hypothetical protein